jgi:hypothetical protein
MMPDSTAGDIDLLQHMQPLVVSPAASQHQAPLLLLLPRPTCGMNALMTTSLST